MQDVLALVIALRDQSASLSCICPKTKLFSIFQEDTPVVTQDESNPGLEKHDVSAPISKAIHAKDQHIPDKEQYFDEAGTTGRVSSQYKYLIIALKILLWLIIWGTFIEVGFGAVFFVVSVLVFVYFSTRTGPKRGDGPSAYSVFNPNCERIEGTFTAEQFEKELRYGALAVH